MRHGNAEIFAQDPRRSHNLSFSRSTGCAPLHCGFTGSVFVSPYLSVCLQISAS